MKILSTLKLHFFAFKKYYIIFWSIIFVGFAAVLGFVKDINTVDYKLTVLLIALLIIFTFAIGYYEFYKLSDYYLGLKVNRLDFYTTSIIFAIINSLINTIIFYIMISLMLNYYLKSSYQIYIFPYNNFLTYLLVFLMLLSSFLVSNLFSLFFSKKIKLTPIVYIIITIAISLVSIKLIPFILDNVYIWFNHPIVNILIITNLLISSLGIIGIYFKFKNISI